LHRSLDVEAGLLGWLTVEDLDLAALGNPEVLGCLKLAHGVALT